MSRLAKLSFTLILSVFFFNTSFAQKKRVPFDVVIKTSESQRFHGSLAAINGAELVLVDNKDLEQHVSYTKIKSIKVYKKHKDVAYGLITSALAAAAIVGGQSVDDANVAVVIAVGGTATVVGLSLLLHNVIHGPEATLKSSKEKIDYQSVSQKLGNYVLKDQSVKP